MLEKLLEPLQYSFMQRSIIVAILIGNLCAEVGSLLIIQRLDLLSDEISDSVMACLGLACR